MLPGRLLTFGVTGAHTLDHALNRGAPALGTDRKHNHAIIHFDENRSSVRPIGGRERHPAAHHLTDRRDDTFDAHGLSFEARGTRQHLRKRRDLDRVGATPKVSWPAPRVATDMDARNKATTHRARPVIGDTSLNEFMDYVSIE